MVCLQSLGCCIRPIISQHRYPTAGMGTNPHGLENNISRALPHIAAFVKTRAFRAGVVPATAVSCESNKPLFVYGLIQRDSRITDSHRRPGKTKQRGRAFRSSGRDLVRR